MAAVSRTSWETTMLLSPLASLSCRIRVTKTPMEIGSCPVKGSS